MSEFRQKNPLVPSDWPSRLYSLRRERWPFTTNEVSSVGSKSRIARVAHRLRSFTHLGRPVGIVDVPNTGVPNSLKSLVTGSPHIDHGALAGVLCCARSSRGNGTATRCSRGGA